MVDVATLEARTARLREQAAKLHQADADAGAATYKRVGQQKDEANQQLRAAQQALEAAEAQAKEQHAKAQELEQQARDLEEGAKDEWNKMERISENDLEQAQKLRAVAAAAAERAAENHRAVARHQAEVQRIEAQIDGLQTTLDLGNTPTERLADQIDDMVDRGHQAAVYLREAERLDTAGDAAGAAAMREAADLELQLLEEIRPDYASVEPAVLTEAGITAADRDLIDPTVLPDDPTASASPPDASSADPAAAPSTDPPPLVDVEVGAEGGDTTADPSTTAQPVTTTALREPSELDAEVAALRGQATKRHELSKQRLEQALADAGGERDEAAAEAWALRQKAKAADIQATREHREATEYEASAAARDAAAAELAKAGKHAEAEDERENADALRSHARSHTQRAQEAEERAQQAIDAAVPLEAQVAVYETDTAFDKRPKQIEDVADAVDDKVRLLEDAIAAREEAFRLRAAGDTAKAVEAAQRAVDAQARADALQPAYDTLEADVRVTAGIEDPSIEVDPAPTHIDMEPEVIPLPGADASTDADGWVDDTGDLGEPSPTDGGDGWGDVGTPDDALADLTPAAADVTFDEPDLGETAYEPDPYDEPAVADVDPGDVDGGLDG